MPRRDTFRAGVHYFTITRNAAGGHDRDSPAHFPSALVPGKVFRWRGGEITRLEAFCGVVFGFALTLLVVWPEGRSRRRTADPAIIAGGVLCIMQDFEDEDELPILSGRGEGLMEEVPATGSGHARRNEDIALDLMKFIAMTTGYGRTASSGVGFQGTGSAAKPEDYAAHLLELYGKCLGAVAAKK
jgi:hypothetical protein